MRPAGDWRTRFRWRSRLRWRRSLWCCGASCRGRPGRCDCAPVSGSDEAVPQVFQAFLTARGGLRVQAFGGDHGGGVFQRACQQGLRLGLVPTGIAGGAGLFERAILQQGGGGFQGAGAGVHAAHMGQDQIGRVQRLAADLGVKVGAAGVEAAVLQDFVIGDGGFGDIVGELVGAPGCPKRRPWPVRVQSCARPGRRGRFRCCT